MPLMPMPPIPMKWMGPISRGSLIVRPVSFVMPGLVPASTILASFMQDVDGRDKPGHDGKTSKNREFSVIPGRCASIELWGAPCAPENLEIPGRVHTHHPE